MWRIRDPEIRPATLDLSSSGQGELRVSRLWSGGVELINALELVDWDSEDSQFLICEACGYTHCKPGDWVSVRKSGPLVLILPASEYVWGDGGNKGEFEPPHYLKKCGVAYLDLSGYEALRAGHSSFPPAERIRQLSVREATLLFHWDSPARVLGGPPEINIRRDIVLASSEGDHVEQLGRLDALMRRQYGDESAATLRAVSDGERVVSFYLDAGEFTQWDAAVTDGLSCRLLVDSKYVIDGGFGG